MKKITFTAMLTIVANIGLIGQIVAADASKTEKTKAEATKTVTAEVAPSKVKKDYSVSQEAWSGDMQSGAGNFMQNCMPCHGMTGMGDGPLSEDLGGDIKPRDLTNATLISARSDEFLFKVIKFGGKKAGLSEIMPDWGETFDDKGIKNLVHYIRHELCKC